MPQTAAVQGLRGHVLCAQLWNQARTHVLWGWGLIQKMPREKREKREHSRCMDVTWTLGILITSGKEGKAAQSASQAPWGKGGRAGLAKPNCAPFEELLMPFDCVGLLKTLTLCLFIFVTCS